MSYCRLGKDCDLYAWHDVSGKVGMWICGESLMLEHEQAARLVTVLRKLGQKIPSYVEEDIRSDIQTVIPSD